MEPLQTWWATELYPSKDEDTFGVAGDFEVVRAADAQAAIAALQGRVKELEEWQRIVTGTGTDQESVIRLAAHEYTKAAIQCWKEANEKLTADLTQRTAELEAVSNFIGVQYDAETRTWVSGQAPYLSAGTTKQEACVAAVDALRLACATWETKYRDLQAELERVRALIKALPKVEGEIRVIEVATDEWHTHDAIFTTKAGADNYAALLKHRQGMEG